MEEELRARLIESRNNLAAELELGSDLVACICIYDTGWTLIVSAGHRVDLMNVRRAESPFVDKTIYTNPTDAELSHIVDFIVKTCEKYNHVCSKAYGGSGGKFTYYLKPNWKFWTST